jgi:hypothetical protein
MEPYILIHVVLQLQKECSPFGTQDEARINHRTTIFRSILFEVLI